MKTELLNGLALLKHVHFVDQVTASTFISGHIVEEGTKDQTPAGLLGRVGKTGTIVYPDFSTILAMKPEAKQSILADMRRIYDGSLRKEYGTANNLKAREWTGRITFAVGATSAVDSHYGIFQSLGERFVMIRWGRPDGIEAAMSAMTQDSATARTELQDAVKRLFDTMPQIEPTLSVEMLMRVAALADFVTRARTHVERSGYTKEMLYTPEAEAPTRLSQQLSQLAKGVALLDGRANVSDADFTLVQRVAFDCIPTTRRKVIQALMRGGDLAAAAPKATLFYCIQDLEVLGLLSDRELSGLAHQLLWTVETGQFTRNPSPPSTVH